MTENIIIIAVVSLILGSVLFYIIRQKKKGAKCIGCPHCKCCSEKQKNNCTK
ncbi:MAG: FeoB-associated Cys-rich membrane protein [Ruminococcaceae bacterium]|nr:FeoB-associated Cys-rich membrane protein [Oscillospiraceae bacterium]